jgi:hypothetical protein
MGRRLENVAVSLGKQEYISLQSIILRSLNCSTSWLRFSEFMV